MRYATLPAIIVLGLFTSLASAQPDDSNSSAEIRAEIELLRERLNQLEARAASTEAAENERRVTVSGDLRYRHETIDDDLLAERNRQRIRARLRVDADIAENFSVNVTLATGANNPVSANQTLGDGFSRKDIGVDRAFFDWSLSDSLNLRGGKMANPMYRPGGHHLIFDGDLNPAGLAVQYESGRAFANVGGFWAEERARVDDAILAAYQAGFRPTVGDVELTFGASYYDYSNTQGFEPFLSGNGSGNTLDPSGNFLHDYNLVELFAEARFEVAGHPLRLFVDTVENTEVDTFDRGYAIGGRWRSASNPGDWAVRWAYQDIEADAVLGLFTDSDFGGGGTDSEGHVFSGTYVLPNGVNLTGTYFLNERGEAASAKRDYNRLQLDASIGF